MEGLILVLLIVYLYFHVSYGLKEATQITSLSVAGLKKVETLFIVLPLLFSIIIALSNWGSLSGPHNGALVLVFIIAPSALLVALAEIIIFGFVRNRTTGIKALFLTVIIVAYLWFVAEYGA